MARAPAVGLADLIRVAHVHGAGVLRAAALLAGYAVPDEEAAVERGAAPRETRPGPTEPAEQPSVQGERRQGRPSARFHHLVARHAIPRHEVQRQRPVCLDEAAPFTEPVRAPAGGRAPAREPLLPDSRLWPFLRAALGAWQEARTPDLRRLVEVMARCQEPRRARRVRRLRWAPVAQVMLDLDPRLRPFWDDFASLAGLVERLRGRAGLDVLVLEEGPGGRVRPLSTARQQPRPYRPPEPGAPILVLSDLGCLADGVDARQRWRVFGRRLRRGARAPVALMPCRPRPVPGARHARQPEPFATFPWDRGVGLPARLPGRARVVPRSGQADAGGGEEILLDLLAPAACVEPRLLRALRHRLPADRFDVACEARAWLHRHVLRTPEAFFYRDAATVARRRKAFLGQPDAWRRSAVALILAHHDHLNPALVQEERDVCAVLLGRIDQGARRFKARVARTVERAPNVRLDAWVRGWVERQHPGMWASDENAALWAVSNAASMREGTAVLPPGLPLERVVWVLEAPPETVTWRLVQRGEALQAERAGRSTASSDWMDQGSPVAELRAAAPVVEQVGSGAVVALTVGQTLELAEERACWRSDHEEITLAAVRRPPWAHTIGRDHDGLFVGFGEGEEARRAYWWSPGAYPVRDAGGGALGELVLEQGFFLDEAGFRRLQAEGFRQPAWADRAGVDEHGLWAEVTLGGVTQRLRWIRPGTFLMGSPDEEPGRYDDERRHEVVLTRGCWLADTACTQALWQAVTGDNPSRFKGEARPVERVSWDDAVVFIERLNGLRADLALRLPTEAEWEYACRAGTTTPFSFGEDITPEQVNYDGNYPYRRGAKGLYRKRTVEVASLPGNPWGLHEMHGNVWEWCADWYDDYPAGPVVDPVGPEAGGGRVRRGGSWFSSARFARSACRVSWGPGLRHVCHGFRFARGPELEPEQGGEEQGRTDGAGSEGRADGAVGQALRRRWDRIRGRG